VTASDDIREPHLRRDDFLGAFAVVRRKDRILFVRNERVIEGARCATWDLPGGQVEPGELLLEALAREVREETGIVIAGEPRFLFFQEGERLHAEQRLYAWRSFFFAVDDYSGEPRASGEVEEVRWLASEELEGLLDAPYHGSFLEWLRAELVRSPTREPVHYRCAWRDVHR